MRPDQWTTVARIFHDVVTRPASERAAVLASICGNDAELCREVESLLAADAASHSRASLVAHVAGEWSAEAGKSLIGRDVGGYVVVSILGAGGMGEVFLAEDRALGRSVALKLLPAAFAVDPDRLRRFTEEARAASALNHPNIITVHAIGEFEGRRYISTEFIDGETLRDRIAHGPLPAAEAIDIAVQTARALSAAHAAGIVHRDIKPENIMIRRDGYVKLLDFGLAKMAEDERLTSSAESNDLGASPATQVGAILGTATYMAPEQAGGREVDGRADLYSLSVVLHEMLHGTVPNAPGVSTILETDVSHRLSKELDRVVRRGLAVAPAARYQTADDLARDLDALPFGSGTQGGARTWRTAALVMLVMVVAAGVVWVRTLPKIPSVGSVAVLPFTSPEATADDQQHLRLGMTDALIARLGEARRLRVTPASTIRHFVGSPRSPTDIGGELGVAAIVTGSLRRAGGRLHATAQVLRVSDGEPLWTGRFDEPSDNVFSIPDGISQQIAATLALDVDGDALRRIRRRETRDSEAYDFYARGREEWARRTPDAIRRAIGLFERALELDPDFPLAYAGLANAYALTASGLLPEDRFPRAKEAALQALALDETVAEAHNALAFISYKWDWDWAAAERRFDQAMGLEPTYALARQWHSEFLSILGRHDEALSGFAEAQNLDPYSTAIRVDRAAALVRAKRAPDAIAILQAAIQQTPRVAALHDRLYNALLSVGRVDEAFEAFLQARVLGGGTPSEIERMRQLHREGRFDAVLRADLTHLLEVDRTGRSRGYYSRLSIAATIARTYALVGDRENALRWLTEAARRRDDGALTMRTMWYWDPFRDHPRFKAIEAEVGMP